MQAQLLPFQIQSRLRLLALRRGLTTRRGIRVRVLRVTKSQLQQIGQRKTRHRILDLIVQMKPQLIMIT